ncbi:hypothetical protein [Acholeplasma palmae]|uniref:hypothetical protein n=1 Tax=Acholeplasma palmae TaxID=38986 RepID=UPI0005FA83EE|nr:hypothetical protein [Alteracholeplasma palmae]
MGLSESLMISFFELVYQKDFIFPAMMMTRGLNYYLAILLTGVIILTFMVLKHFKKGKKDHDRFL